MDELNRIGDFLRMLRSRLNAELSRTHLPDDRQELRETLNDLQVAIESLNLVRVPESVDNGPRLYLFDLATVTRYMVDVEKREFVVTVK